MPKSRTVSGGLLVRGVAIVVLLVGLAVSFVLVGAVETGPDQNDFPRAGDLVEDPEAFTGERVTIEGTIIERDPLTVETDAATDDAYRITVDGVDTDTEIGDNIIAHGVLKEPTHVEATGYVHREPWESSYVYLISLLGGFWVLGRLCNQWRFDTGRLAIVPRETTLLSSLGMWEVLRRG